MADNIPETLTELADTIAATRQLYTELRATLEATLGQFVEDPADVADGLLSHADEFGRDNALAIYVERVGPIPILDQSGEMSSSELTASLTSQIEALFDTHERLDDLTCKREALTEGNNIPGVRVLNIQGQEFVLDGRVRELHAVDRPDAKHVFGIEPGLSLTEQIAQDVGADKAAPQPVDRDRSRTR